MGAFCCKDEDAIEKVLTQDTLARHLVRDKHQEINAKYHVVELIGKGSISTISKIRRRVPCDSTCEVKDPETTSRVINPTSSSNQELKKVESISTNEFYALKEIDMGMISQSTIDELKNEIDILSSLDHPNIIKVYETYHFKRKTSLVMELCQGDDVFSKYPYSEATVCLIVKQILSALVYLHDRNIVHRDIKCENIMFVTNAKDDYTVKIIDFGLAKKFQYHWNVMHERVGTLYSMAPEVMNGGYSGSQSDMWSTGVITYLMLSGQKPFWGKTPKEVIQLIKKGKINMNTPIWKTISKDAINFVTQLLRIDPDSRLTAHAACIHPFIRRTRTLSNVTPDPELLRKVTDNLARYANSCDVKKIALMVIANKLSTQEIFDLRNIFYAFDTSNDGMITFEELKKALSRSSYTEKELHAIFKSIDVNHTGSILYTEFLAASLEAKGNIHRHRLAEAFEELDDDHSGFISKDDLRKFLPETVTDRELENLIKEVDNEDHDGKISFEEFQHCILNDCRQKISHLYNESV